MGSPVLRSDRAGQLDLDQLRLMLSGPILNKDTRTSEAISSGLDIRDRDPGLFAEHEIASLSLGRRLQDAVSNVSERIRGLASSPGAKGFTVMPSLAGYSSATS